MAPLFQRAKWHDLSTGLEPIGLRPQNLDPRAFPEFPALDAYETYRPNSHSWNSRKIVICCHMIQHVCRNRCQGSLVRPMGPSPSSLVPDMMDPLCLTILSCHDHFHNALPSTDHHLITNLKPSTHCISVLRLRLCAESCEARCGQQSEEAKDLRQAAQAAQAEWPIGWARMMLQSQWVDPRFFVKF